jgi:hypothetical protein
MIASHLLLCFVLTAYDTDLGPPLGICSAPEALTNVCAYSTAKVIVGLTGFTDHPVSPGRPRIYPQETSTPLVRLATSPRPPPRFIDSIQVQRNPNLCTEPTPNICSAENKSVLIRNEMIHPAGHDTDTSDMENFMKRLTDDAKPMTIGHKHMWILFAKKNVSKNICGYGPQLFYTMTHTYTKPACLLNSSPRPPPPPPLSLCCKLLHIITVSLISAALLLRTAGVFGFAKQFNKLTGFKIPCWELLLVLLTLFPGAAAVQGLINHNNSIQVVVHTNANASTFTSMDVVDNDNVTSWAQLVTACAAPSANITLSRAFKMGVYFPEDINVRLVLCIYIWSSELETMS